MHTKNLGIRLCWISIFFMFCCTDLSAQHIDRENNASYYIVRHAEKDTGSDPRISSIGMKRAEDLYAYLASVPIDKILVTRYRRTAMTGDSVRIKMGIDTALYAADLDGKGLKNCLNGLPANEHNFLVIGHSNTLPGIIRSLGIHSFHLKELPDYAYDRLYIIRVRHGEISFEEKRYGSVSLEPAVETIMQPL